MTNLSLLMVFPILLSFLLTVFSPLVATSLAIPPTGQVEDPTLLVWRSSSVPRLLSMIWHLSSTPRSARLLRFITRNLDEDTLN